MMADQRRGAIVVSHTCLCGRCPAEIHGGRDRPGNRLREFHQKLHDGGWRFVDDEWLCPECVKK